MTAKRASSKMKRPRAESALAAKMLRRLRQAQDVRARKIRRIGIDLSEGLRNGEVITPDPKQPLAINMNLTDAARSQAAWLIANSTFSHSGPGGNSPYDRMLASGWQTSGNTETYENAALTLVY